LLIENNSYFAHERCTVLIFEVILQHPLAHHHLCHFHCAERTVVSPLSALTCLYRLLYQDRQLSAKNYLLIYGIHGGTSATLKYLKQMPMPVKVLSYFPSVTSNSFRAT